MAKLGIICCIYNDTQYIEPFIRSCKNINEKNVNIYIVNDYSTIDVATPILKLIDKNKKFRYIENTSGYFGLGSARNFMLDKIDDEYVSFVDIDDFVSPEYHEKLLKLADSYSLDCIKTGWTIVNKEKRIESQLESNIPVNEILPGVEYFAPYNKSNLFDRPHSWAGIYKKNFLDENKIRFSKLLSAEDRLFWFKCLIYSKRVMAIPITNGYYYRKENDENRLTSIGNKNQNEFFRAAQEIISFAKKNVTDERVWQKLITQIIALTDFHFRNRNRLSEIALYDLYVKAAEVIDALKACPEYYSMYEKFSKQRKELIDVLDNGVFIYE